MGTSVGSRRDLKSKETGGLLWSGKIRRQLIIWYTTAAAAAAAAAQLQSKQNPESRGVLEHGKGALLLDPDRENCG